MVTKYVRVVVGEGGGEDKEDVQCVLSVVLEVEGREEGVHVSGKRRGGGVGWPPSGL